MQTRSGAKDSPAHSSQPFFSERSGNAHAFFAPTVQAKCASCEQEEKLQRQEKDEELSGPERVAVQAKCACHDEDAAPQTKLTIGKPGDRFEQEADATADSVMRSPAATFPAIHGRSGPFVHRAVEAQSEEDRQGDAIDAEFGIQMKEASGAKTGYASGVPTAGGSPLSGPVRSFFEDRFGRDLTSVRVHTGPDADRSAESLNARAYTHRNHIVFRDAEYSPSTAAGGWLLAHELTHVAQQGHAPALSDGAHGATQAPLNVPQRSGDTTTPTVRLIDKEYAKALTPDELDMAIEQLKAEIDLYTSTSPTNLYLQQNLDLLQEERESRKDVPFDESEFDVEDEDWSPGKVLHGIVRGDPANLRPAPSKDNTPTPLPMNTKLVIESDQGNWYNVKTADGRSGWVTKELVETNLPDPDSQLYIVQAGDTAQKIAQKFYGPHAKDWGQDERFFVNVLYYINLQFAAQPGTKSMYRPADSQEDWAQTMVVKGSRVWIPGVDAALALKGVVPSGSITYELWQTVKEIFIGTAAFIVGLLEGALESIVDVFVGLWDLIKIAWSVVKSLITGEIFNDIKKLTEDLSKLKLSDIIDAGIAWFKDKWFAESTWARWKFRGWLIGYVVMEILMLIFSDGIATAVKWVGKTGKLAKVLEKFPTLVKLAEKAKKLTGPAADVIRAGAKALSAAHTWAMSVLRIPLEIIKDTAAPVVERLKKLPGWIQDKFRHLSAAAMKALLRCKSPCEVNLEEIEKWFKELAVKGAKGTKRLTSVDDILAALPKKMNKTLIRKKLGSRPALMKLIEKAELTDLDLVKLEAFFTVGDEGAAQAYRTFVRYLTNVVPVKTEGNITKFNEIAEAIVKADVRQGAALKGSMFEQFAKLNVPELGGKSFMRITFKRSASLKLTKATRTADNFVESTGAIWDMKHGLSKVPLDQVEDYAKVIGQVTADGKEIKSINYLFATEEMARKNAQIAAKAGFNVHYIDPVKKVLVKL